MCGRYFVEYDEKYEMFMVIKKQLEKAGIAAKSGDIRPSEAAAVISGTNRVELMRWGTKFGGKLLINARAEGLSERSMFRDYGRCIIAASGFYEWSRNKEQFSYRGKASPLYLAGVYTDKAEERPLFSGIEGIVEKRFVILTEAAKEPILSVHHRMPLILPPEGCKAWLSGQDIRYFMGNTPVLA